MIDVAHHRDHRWPGREVLLLTGVLTVGQVEGLQQLAVLILRTDDLDLVVHLLAEQLQHVVGDGLGRGDHLAEVEQRLHQRGVIGVDLIGVVGE